MITDTDNTAIENRIVSPRLNVRVPSRLHEELKRRAREEAESESTLVRRALQLLLRDSAAIETR